MLVSIRKKLSGWIAWLVVIIIAVPFALFGINAYFEGTNYINVANVNGEKISLQAFQQAAERQRQLFRNQFGNRFNTSVLDTPTARRGIVEDLVINQLERDYVTDNNLTLSDAALQQRIVQNAAFQEAGQFSQAAYRRVLSVSGYTIEGYEQQERAIGATEQLRNGLIDSNFVNNAEVDHLLRLNLQQREADYFIVEAKPLEADITPSEEAISTQYQENPDDYQQYARIKVDYVELKTADIEKDIELSEDELKQAFENSKGRYTQPETRQASHILLSVPNNASDYERATILAKAESILAEANEGADFAALAETHSQDLGSSKQGGDLGILSKGQMVAPFEEAAFAMTADEIRGPIKTQFGYHIIKLTELLPERQAAFEKVIDEVRTAEQKRLAIEQFTEIAETFRNLVFEQADDLLEVAESLGLEIITSDWLTENSGAAPFTNPRVRRVAFDAAVLEDDLNSEVIMVRDGHLLALHKNTYEETRLKSLDEVREQITEQLKQRGANALATEQGQALIAQLQAGDDFNEEQLARVKTLPELRSALTDATERAIGANVFSAAAPEDSQALIDGLSLQNGDYALFRLKNVTLGDPAQATEAQRDQIVQQLNQRDGGQLYILFRQVLRENADVEIFSSTFAGDDLDDGRY